ncbi:SEL1-like repeat protein [Tannockella kyphosi]|uniref:SEL1-like repeat protein n=1 Tax=Tannockella kyphosi TaxID=2899121 RepID=UPI0020120B38|nr:tetratricopeptide repeat protein [Tannockella kyphosi]
MDRYNRAKDYEPLFDQWYIDGLIETGHTQSVFSLKNGYTDSIMYLRIVTFHDDDIEFLEDSVERVLSLINMDGGKFFGQDISDFEQYIIEVDGAVTGIDVCMLMEEYDETEQDITLIDGHTLHAMGLHYVEQKEFQHAVECFREGRNQGYRECIGALGGMYDEGYGIEQNYTEAAKLYLEASEMGDVLSTCNLGILYEEGLGVEKDEYHAFELYKRVELEGFPKTNYRLGYCYELGIGTPIDLKLAVENYKIASEGGYIDAFYFYAMCLEYGEGVEKDYVKAAFWYGQGVEVKDERCMYRLGVLYEHGFGFDMDYFQAANLYQASADLGYLPAIASLANCYEFGNGVEMDSQKARELFLMAARSGYERAQVFLGFYYEEHLEIRHALFRAKYWYKQAVKSGDPQAMCGLGFLYEIEWGQPEKAFEYYMQAVELEYSPAICNVAYCYEIGVGVEEDINKAIEYYQRASALGFPRAMCNLANIYLKIGTPENLELSFDLNMEAARRGYSSGYFNVGAAYQFGNHVEKDNEKAKEYYRLAANQGHTTALYNLASVYEEEENSIESLKILYELHDAKYPEAGYRIFFALYELKDDRCWDYLKESANLGYVPSIYEMADYYIDNENKEEALRCFDTAAKAGYEDAIAKLGWCYLVGFEVKTDKRKAVELLKEADTGYSNYLLGCMYLYGDGRKQNNRLAQKYLDKAVNQGYEDADEELIELYRRKLDEL